MRKILLLSASLVALTCTAASAGSITIGLQEDAGATQQFSGGSNFAITGASTTGRSADCWRRPASLSPAQTSPRHETQIHSTRTFQIR
jgi:hypothetical protein